MSDTETWGIVLRDRDGAEQWIACEVTRDGDIVTARAHGYGYGSVEYAQTAVEGVGCLILQHDASLSSVRIATPAEYAAHMEGVCLTLAIDEANDLRAEVTRLSDTIGAIGRRVGAESCERDVILDAIGDACDAARRGGEVSMRHAAASWCERAGHAELAADIREFALTGSQPAQSHEAPATPSAPLNVADAAARARSAAAQRAMM
jgi:hypothetical protein